MKNIMATVKGRMAVLLFLVVFVLFGISVVLSSFELQRNGDMWLYRDSASRMLSGQPPRADFASAYPLLATLYFILPALVTGNVLGYALVFASLQLCVFLASVYLVYACAKKLRIARDSAVIKYAIASLLLANLIVGRYDLLPATVTLAGAYFFLKERYGVGFALIAVGVWLKYYSIFLLPILLIAYLEKRTPRKLAADMVPAVFAAFLCVALGALVPYGGNIAESLAFHAVRLPNVESVYSAVLLMINIVFPLGVRTEYLWHSTTIRFPFENEVSIGSFFVMAAVMLLVYAAAYRSRRNLSGTTLIGFCALAVLAFILTSKVFSPQYLLWVSPFICLLGLKPERLNKQIFAAFALACGFSLVIYPYTYSLLNDLDPLAVVVVALRDFVLVGVFVFLVVWVWRAKS